MDSEKFYTSINHLAKRSVNTLKKIGGVSGMIKHYKTYGTFLNIENSGRRTDEQLTSFSKYLIDNNFENLDERQIAEEDVEMKPLVEINPNTQTILIDTYLSQKSRLSVRAKNALDQLETLEFFNNEIHNKYKFIEKCFINNYDFLRLRNIGLKTLSEIKDLKEIIANTIETFNFEEDDSLLLKTLECKIRLILNNTQKNIEIDKFIIEKIIVGYLLEIPLPVRKKEILCLHYFTEEIQDIEELSQKAQCSTERVRQILIDLKHNIIPHAVNYVVHQLGNTYTQLEEFSTASVLHLNAIPPVSIYSNNFIPNAALSECIYSTLLKHEFIHINDTLRHYDSPLKSFVQTPELVYLSNNFISSSNFFTFIKWADEQIYNFETSEFEYDLRVLIARYYKENNMDIDDSNLREIFLLIGKIRRTDWDNINNLKIRKRKQIKREEIYTRAYELIKAMGQPQKTINIYNHLLSHGFDLDKETLLRHLNKNKTIFTQLGSGYWAIKNTAYSKNIGGSLRSIVLKMLNESEVPLHISEIISTIEQFRKINESSLLSNLRADEHNTFISFNCSYIGLKTKNYDVYWYGLPSVNGQHCNIKTLNKKGLITIEEMVDYLFTKYCYPKTHTKHLLLKKVE